MKKIHYFSGLFITVFIAFHLINHAFSIVSLEKHLEIMKIFRVVYRNIFIESILLLAVLFQIFSGIKLSLQAKKNTISFFDKLHIYSGLYLAMFLLIHVSAVLSARIIFNLDSNSYFGAAALNQFPLVIMFIPYYFFAIFSFFTHVACIHYKKTNAKNQSYSIMVFGFLVGLFLIYAMTNHFQGYTVPAEYNKMLESMSF